MFTKMKGDLEFKMVFHQKPYLHFVTAITIPNFIITVMSLWQITACSLISLLVDLVRNLVAHGRESEGETGEWSG
jgi:hypothetical protein